MNNPSADTPLVPCIELEGSFRDMGHAHGEIAREQIQRLADVRVDLIKRLNDLRSTDDVQAVCELMASEIKLQTPLVYTETAATAVAANIGYWQLIAAGAFSDVVDIVARRAGRVPNAPNECTLVVLHTKEYGRIIIGTWDTHATAADSLILCRRRHTGDNQTVALSTAGWPMQQGVTSRGISFAIANLVSKSVHRGVPYIAALPHVTHAGSVAEVVAKVTSLAHASARFYMFCGADSTDMIEIAPGSGAAQSRSFDIAHTNHFVYRADYEGRVDTRNSQKRLEQASGLIPSLHSRSTVEEVLTEFIQSGVLQCGTGDDDRTGVAFALLPAEGAVVYSCAPGLFKPTPGPFLRVNIEL